MGDSKQCSGLDCGGSSLFLANQARGVIQGPLQYNLEPGVFRTILAIFNARDFQCSETPMLHLKMSGEPSGTEELTTIFAKLFTLPLFFLSGHFEQF